MSESGLHRNLVQALADAIAGDPVWAKHPIVYCDIQVGMCQDLPPIIGGNRPDVYARDLATSLSIIGEAKTPDDIDNRHTFAQLASFFHHLRHQPAGELWMGVPWMSAGTAFRVCKHVRTISNAQHIPFRVVSFNVGLQQSLQIFPL